jgi:polyhydroxyalkanoate synthase
MADVVWDDYVEAQIDAIDTVREAARRRFGAHDRLLRGRHHARRDAGGAGGAGQADKVKSATFFTAQVDFARAGDLSISSATSS